MKAQRAFRCSQFPADYQACLPAVPSISFPSVSEVSPEGCLKSHLPLSSSSPLSYSSHGFQVWGPGKSYVAQIQSGLFPFCPTPGISNSTTALTRPFLCFSANPEAGRDQRPRSFSRGFSLKQTSSFGAESWACASNANSSGHAAAIPACLLSQVIRCFPSFSISCSLLAPLGHPCAHIGDVTMRLQMAWHVLAPTAEGCGG